MKQLGLRPLQRLRWSALLASGSSALLLMLASCGDQASVSTSHEAQAGGGGPQSFAADSLEVAVASDVLHSGVRLVTTLDTLQTAGQGSGQGTVQFLERVLSDGTGQFAIEPISAYQQGQPPDGDWMRFSLIQILRQSFHMRYRDFEVRDAVALRKEWTTRELGQAVTVASRSCRRVDVTHPESGRTFELSIDDETQLVLDQRELDAQGELLLQVTYQSLELAPDLSNVVWHVPTPSIQFALDADLEAALGFDAKLPTNLPAGYVLHDIEELDTTVMNDDQGPWLKITFTNGVDPLFYAISIPSALAGGQGSTLPDSDSPGNIFRAVSLGRAAAGVAELTHATVVAVGRVSVDELADLIHSAIPE